MKNEQNMKMRIKTYCEYELVCQSKRVKGMLSCHMEPLLKMRHFIH